MDETPEGGNLTKARLKFFVALSILLLPLIVWFMISQLGDTRCKPLMMVQDVTESGDSLPHVLPPFQLLNQRGEAFNQDSLRGYYHVANFIFTTCPGICVPITEHFVKLQEKVADAPEVRLVSYSVDPETDTPEVLRKYANKHGAIPYKWTFLTGAESDIVRVIKDGYMQAVLKTPDGKEKVTHSGFLVLVDKDLRLRGFYDVLNPQIGKKEFDRLVDEINVLACEYNAREKKN